jgi:hypothetical protein
MVGMISSTTSNAYGHASGLVMEARKPTWQDFRYFRSFALRVLSRGFWARSQGRVLTRINVSNAGWAHVLERHFAGTGSRFSIAQAQLRSLLGSKQVVGSPVVRTLESADGTRFVRQLDIGYTIGVDKFSGANTSILTVLSDEFGNRHRVPRYPAMSEHTLTDKKMLDELERSREQLLSGSSAQGLVRVLRRKLQSITRNIYVFRWIQGEDLYDVLVDGVTVAHVEIPRRDPDQEAIFETLPVEEYRRTRKNLTKTERRKLELALQLAQSFKVTYN